MNNLEFLQRRVDEAKKGLKKSSCLQCGLCCEKYDIPIPKPENPEETIIKKSGNKCPYYAIKDGRGYCVIHNTKHYPKDCEQYNPPVKKQDSIDCPIGKKFMQENNFKVMYAKRPHWERENQEAGFSSGEEPLKSQTSSREELDKEL